MIAVILALLIVIGIAGWEAIDWRRKAEELNDENLELAQRVDELERLLEPKPRIEFGPQLDKPRWTDSEWSHLLDTIDLHSDEVVVRELGGREVRRLRTVPPQREGGDQS